MNTESKAGEGRGAEAPGMSFWDHLDALRRVLLRVVIVWMAGCVCLFAFMPEIFDKVILAPCSGAFCTYRLFDAVASLWPALADTADAGFHIDLINIELASQFFIHMSAACWLSLVLLFPVVIYLLWGFVRPALYERERRGAVKAFLFGNLMFYLGASVGYFIVFPLTVRFLAGYQLSASVPNVISLDSYMNTFFTLVLLMGVIFEMPLLAWVLGRMHLLTRAFFDRYRRHAIVGLLILAAIVTPTGDPFTLLAVFAPVYCVWELGRYMVPRASCDN